MHFLERTPGYATLNGKKKCIRGQNGKYVMVLVYSLPPCVSGVPGLYHTSVWHDNPQHHPTLPHSKVLQLLHKATFQVIGSWLAAYIPYWSIGTPTLHIRAGWFRIVGSECHDDMILYVVYDPHPLNFGYRNSYASILGYEYW